MDDIIKSVVKLTKLTNSIEIDNQLSSDPSQVKRTILEVDTKTQQQRDEEKRAVQE